MTFSIRDLTVSSSKKSSSEENTLFGVKLDMQQLIPDSCNSTLHIISIGFQVAISITYINTRDFYAADFQLSNLPKYQSTPYDCPNSYNC
ncbi:unnamed protein product [Ambrosiozyma monospora]|uniref:Unnamed protein product n=1 Tax=Ambrosiozyma monospora TaxID=43982 RepID=A0ACB5T215_AMBMO|nr:unnamed protein product [Ambrosiozyma monospora]